MIVALVGVLGSIFTRYLTAIPVVARRAAMAKIATPEIATNGSAWCGLRRSQKNSKYCDPIRDELVCNHKTKPVFASFC